MSVFGLPKDFWICKDCGANWAEDNPEECPKCGSKNIEKEDVQTPIIKKAGLNHGPAKTFYDMDDRKRAESFGPLFSTNNIIDKEGRVLKMARYKQKESDGIIDITLGFRENKETVELEPKATEVAIQKKQKKTIVTTENIYKRLCEKFGSYGISWYFIDNSTDIKYFKDNQWHIKGIYEILRGESD